MMPLHMTAALGTMVWYGMVWCHWSSMMPLHMTAALGTISSTLTSTASWSRLR